MSRNDRSSRDLAADARSAAMHPSRFRHKPRGCGQGPAIPANLSINFDAVDAPGRHNRLRAYIQGDRVQDADRYVVNLQVSKDGGNTWLTPWRHKSVEDSRKKGFTAKASTDEFTAKNHGYANDEQVILQGHNLPTGVDSSHTYFIRAATSDKFKLATSAGGSAINLTADGAGKVLNGATSFTAEFHDIRRAYLYRYRVRADGECPGDWGPGTSTDPADAGAGWSIGYDPNDPEVPPPVDGLLLNVGEHEVQGSWDIPADPVENNLPDLRIEYMDVELWRDALDSGTRVERDKFVHGDHKTFKVHKPGNSTFWLRVTTYSAAGVAGPDANTSSSKAVPSTPTVSSITFDTLGTKHARFRGLVTVTTGSADSDAEADTLVVEFVHKASHTTPTSSDRKHRERIEPDPDASGDLVAVFRNIRKDHWTYARVKKADTERKKSAWSGWTDGGKPSGSMSPSAPTNVVITHPAHQLMKATWDPPAGDDEDATLYMVEFYCAGVLRETRYIYADHARYNVPNADAGTFHSTKVYTVASDGSLSAAGTSGSVQDSILIQEQDIAEDDISFSRMLTSGAQLYVASGTQNVNDTTDTVVDFDTVAFDTIAGADLTNNWIELPNDLNNGGVFLIQGRVQFQANSTGRRRLKLQVSNDAGAGWTDISQIQPGATPGGPTDVPIMYLGTLPLLGGGTHGVYLVRLLAFQDSGGALGMNPGVGVQYLTALYMGSGG